MILNCKRYKNTAFWQYKLYSKMYSIITQYELTLGSLGHMFFHLLLLSLSFGAHLLPRLVADTVAPAEQAATDTFRCMGENTPVER